MIKMNESYVGDVVFEILAKTVVKFLCFYIVFSIDKSFISINLVTIDIQLQWGLHQHKTF